MLLYLLMCAFVVNVVAGTPATQGQFRYQALIRYNGTFKCSGSILNRDTILTAASCLEDKDGPAYTVVVGDTNRNVIEGTEQAYVVKVIITHQQYNSETKENDIALMILGINMEYDSFVHNVRIPKGGESWYYGKDNAKITGWGESQDLLQLQTGKILPTSDQSTCDSKKRANMMCVDPVTDCLFDLGSPLAIESDGNLVQVGIASVNTCVETAKKALFTDVGAYTLWIDSLTGDIDTGAGHVTKLSTALIFVTTVIIMILPLY